MGIETTQGAAAAIQAKITNNMKTDFGTASVSTVASPVISATLPTTMKATMKTTKKAVVTKKAVKANSTNNTTRKGVVADHALPVAVLSNMLAITLTVLHCI